MLCSTTYISKELTYSINMQRTAKAEDEDEEDEKEVFKVRRNVCSLDVDLL